ncbi:hypothetical protein B0H13DRAFT_1871662 [Mycena leptocephala]|nr:hypothetical protein B0H13DRAFT_1871662 [Mycena leptocephala]
MCATGARWGEAKSPSPRFKTPLPAQGDRAPPARKCPPGGGSALPPDENSLRVEHETASGGDYDVSVDEKTTRNTRRELSDKRRGDEDNEANLQLVSAINNGDKRKLKRISLKGTATFGRRRTAPGQRAAKSIQELRGSVRTDEWRNECSLKRECMSRLSRDSQHATLPPVRSRIRSPARAPTTRAEHAARNSKGKGTKSRQDARAAGRARQIRLGRRPRGCQSQSDGPSIHKHARDRDARPSRPPRKTTPLTRRQMPALQNLSHRNMCGPGWREQRSRRERAGGAMLFEDRPYVLVLGLLRLGFWACLRGLGSVQRGG